MPISLVGLDPTLANLIQVGTIERNVREALVAETLFRTDIPNEVFEGKIGEMKNIARTGLLPVSITPLQPGVDPTPKNYAKETFRTQLNKWGDTVDAYMPHDYIGVVKESMTKSKALGVNAAQTVDRIVRAALYRAFLAGNTISTVASAIGQFRVHVASINGFTEINDPTTGIPVPVSAAVPLTVTFGGAEPAKQCVLATADDPVNAPFGPGWLLFSAALTAGVAAREAVLAANRSNVIIAGGGNTVDAIAAADTLTMADIINAVASLRSAPATPRFPDGMYHCHLPVMGEAQLLMDPMVRGIIHTDRIPDMYRRAAIGELGGALLLRNEMCPDSLNAGALVSTGAGASFGAPEIGGEVINNAGVRIGYTMIYGQGHAYETYVPPGATPAENQISEARQMPAASSGGVSLNTERIEFIVRPPFDRMNEVTAFSWKFIGDFPIPSDIVSGARRYRRAVVIAHAIG